MPLGVTSSSQAPVTARPPVDAYIRAGVLDVDSRGRVQVYIALSASGPQVLEELESLGVVIERQSESGRLLQARVAVQDLPRLAALDYVQSVTPPVYGRANAGSRMTEGDNLLAFDALRAILGVDGSGVTVGVISDGIAGMEEAMASGDLPATALSRDGTGKLVSTSGGIIATSFRADGDLEAGAEGTAILEIVHDIAPGAQLRFANFSTSLEFMAAVDFLAANSDIVIDDISFFGGPYDQSSDVSANTASELNRPENRIRGYYTSVGNLALRHYQEQYLDSGEDGLALVGSAGHFHQFQATSRTSDCLGLGPSVANHVLLEPGQAVLVVLTWDDVFGAATTDYDIYAFRNDTGTLVDSGINDNINVTRDPVEQMVISNTSDTTNLYDIYIHNFEDASPPVTFDMFVLGDGVPCTTGALLNYNTMESSVPMQSDAGGGVVSVGAIAASDPGLDTIEPFSSRGPANNGAIKPDITAVDGVSVTGAGGFFDPFFGTSASAPHLAGLAALLLDLKPELMAGEEGDNPPADREALRTAILTTAVDLGAAGPDNTFGVGRANGLSAGQALASPGGEPTPTPTPTPTPVPSLSTWGLLAMGAALLLLLLARMSRSAPARGG